MTTFRSAKRAGGTLDAAYGALLLQLAHGIEHFIAVSLGASCPMLAFLDLGILGWFSKRRQGMACGSDQVARTSDG